MRYSNYNSIILCKAEPECEQGLYAVISEFRVPG